MSEFSRNNVTVLEVDIDTCLNVYGVAPCTAGRKHTGTAQAGGASTITLAASASGSDSAYNNMIVRLTGGTGSGQERTISAYVGATKVATVSVAWTPAPDATSVYAVIDRPNACYNTFRTCQDRPNYVRGTKTFKFMDRGAPIPAGEALRPYLSSIKFAPTEIDPDAGVARRASVSLTAADETDSDIETDQYVAARTAKAQGTFWARFFSRVHNYSGRPARIKRAYLTGAWNWADFTTELYQIEAMKGPSARGEVGITLKDPLKIADRVKLPAPSSGKLGAALANNDLRLVLRLGDGTQYSPSGYVRVGDQIIRYTRKQVENGWNFTNNTLDGFTATNATLASGADTMMVTSTAANPQIRVVANIYGYKYRYVIARLRSTVKGSLLRFDGAAGSTAIIDDNPSNTWGVIGNAQISTIQSRTGGASLLLDGADDFVTGAAVPLAAGQGFNRYIWFRLTTDTVGSDLMSGKENTRFLLRAVGTAGKLELSLGNGATWSIAFENPGVTIILTGIWYRVRVAWNGSTYKVYLSVNGALETEEITITSAVAHATGTGTLIGKHAVQPAVFNGHIDEYRNVVGATVLGAETPRSILWEGALYYTTSQHGESESYTKVISEPAGIASGYALAVWDMHALTFGGTDWQINTVLGLRLDLDHSSGSVYEIDWIGWSETATLDENVLTLPDSTSRSQFGTTAVAQKIGDGVQQCLVYVDQPFSTVVQNLLNTAGITNANIDLAGLQSEDSSWLGSRYRITAALSEPEDVSVYLGELALQSGGVLWWSPMAQKVKYKFIGPASPAAVTGNTFTDAANIVDGSMQVEPLDNLRKTFVAIYYELYSATANRKEAKNYTRGEIYIDTDAEGGNEYNDRRVEINYSRWFSNVNSLAMDTWVRRRLGQYRDAPKKLDFKIDPKDAVVAEGDLYDITTSALTSFNGAPQTVRCLIVKRMDNSGDISITARSTNFSRRYGFIAPNGTGNYPNNSGYACVSSAAGAMADGTSGYLVI